MENRNLFRWNSDLFDYTPMNIFCSWYLMNIPPFLTSHHLTGVIIFARLLIIYHNEIIYSQADRNKWGVYNVDVGC